jgi:hypothetical protein
MNPDKDVQDNTVDIITNNTYNSSGWTFSFFEKQTTTAFAYAGPTVIQIYKDELTYYNTLRVIEEDVPNNSRYLLEYPILDKS